jgi:hypothetical protein
LRSAGKWFTGRYFGPGVGKLATPAEVAALHAAGLAVVALAEGFERDALLGHAKGVEHAQSADTATFLAGMAPDRPIYFAVDFNMTVAQRPAVRAYLQGCADTIGRDRVGVYGGVRTTEWAANNGYAAWFFQAAAWSDGVWGPHAYLQQYANGVTVAGGRVDLCRAVVTDFGQWPHAAETLGHPSSTPAPAVTTGPWDYTPDMSGLGSDVSGSATTLAGYGRTIDQLRT